MQVQMLAIAALTALVGANVNAQVSTATKPDGIWRGGIGLGAALARGNTESTNINGVADAIRQTEGDKTGLYISTLRNTAKIDDANKTTANLLRLGGRYERDFDGNLYGFGALDIEKDKPADIKWRWLPQAGVGMHIIKSPTTTFDVFTGLAYNKTDRYLNPDSNSLEALIGQESSHKLTDTTSFVQRLVVYPALTGDRKSEYRMVFDAGLKAQVIGGWNLTLTVSSRYDSEPAPGKKKNDTVFFTGLQYVWGPSSK